MDEMVNVCLESKPRICLSVPARLALAGVAGFIIGKVIVNAIRADKPKEVIKDRSSGRRFARQ